jgi:hypothetical protein
MYKTELVAADIADGKRVVSALEDSGLKITAAFWFYSEEEYDDWYLIVVSPDVAEKGSTLVYKQAFAPLHTMDIDSPRPINFWWDRIKIISPSSLTYQMLKQRAARGDKPVREGPTSDAYIYKME